MYVRDPRRAGDVGGGGVRPVDEVGAVQGDAEDEELAQEARPVVRPRR